MVVRRATGGPRAADAAAALRYLRAGTGGRINRRGRRRGAAARVVIGALLCALAGLAAGGAYAARRYLTHAPRFTLRRIEISPTRHAPQGELRRTLARHLGKNVFRLDLARLERDLEGRRWVKRAVVKRSLPDGVFCAVEERVPRGLALLGDKVWLVDDEGVAIDPYGEGATREAAARYSFPIFTGVAAKDGARARAQVRRGVAFVASLQDSFPALLPQISEVDLARDDRIDLRLDGGGPLLRLHPKEFGTNLDRWLSMREYLATDFGDGAYVDLRFRDRIAFRPLLARARS